MSGLDVSPNQYFPVHPRREARLPHIQPSFNFQTWIWWE